MTLEMKIKFSLKTSRKHLQTHYWK